MRTVSAIDRATAKIAWPSTLPGRGFTRPLDIPSDRPFAGLCRLWPITDICRLHSNSSSARTSSDVAAWPREVRHKAGIDRIADVGKDERDRAGQPPEFAQSWSGTQDRQLSDTGGRELQFCRGTGHQTHLLDARSGVILWLL